MVVVVGVVGVGIVAGRVWRHGFQTQSLGSGWFQVQAATQVEELLPEDGRQPFFREKPEDGREWDIGLKFSGRWERGRSPPSNPKRKGKADGTIDQAGSAPKPEIQNLSGIIKTRHASNVVDKEGHCGPYQGMKIRPSGGRGASGVEGAGAKIRASRFKTAASQPCPARGRSVLERVFASGIHIILRDVDTNPGCCGQDSLGILARKGALGTPYLGSILPTRKEVPGAWGLTVASGGNRYGVQLRPCGLWEGTTTTEKPSDPPELRASRKSPCCEAADASC